MALFKRNTWALAANGGRATIIENLDDPDTLKIHQFDAEQIKAGDLLTDRNGRTFSSVGDSRSELQQHSDPVRHQERLFAKHIAEYLTPLVDCGELNALVVTASPRMLGDLRKAFPERLLKQMDTETGKDFTNLSESELVETLGNLVRNKNTPAIG